MNPPDVPKVPDSLPSLEELDKPIPKNIPTASEPEPINPLDQITQDDAESLFKPLEEPVGKLGDVDNPLQGDQAPPPPPKPTVNTKPNPSDNPEPEPEDEQQPDSEPKPKPTEDEPKPQPDIDPPPPSNMPKINPDNVDDDLKPLARTTEETLADDTLASTAGDDNPLGFLITAGLGLATVFAPLFHKKPQMNPQHSINPSAVFGAS